MSLGATAWGSWPRRLLAAWTGAEDGAPRRNRTFAGWFGAALITPLVGMAGLNLLVNPWRVYPARLYPPLVQDSRPQKCALLRQVQPPPEQLVLGSSRVMMFEPALLERLTGLRTFNAGVEAGTPVDSLALFRLATEGRGAPVRSVILGIDTLCFFEGKKARPDLAANPDLAPYLGEERRRAGQAARLWQLFSSRQTRDSWKVLRRRTPGEEEVEALYDERGGPSAFILEATAAQRRLNFAQPANRQLSAGFLNPRRGTPPDLRDLERLLAHLRRRRVRMVGVLLPCREPLWERWRTTGFLPRVAAAQAEVATLLRRYGGRCVDFSRVAAFDGDPADFYDAIHPTIENCRRMIRTLSPALGAAPARTAAR